jgi:hypothetical protein
MDFLDKNCSPVEVNLGRMLTCLKFDFFFFKKSPSTFKSRPNGEKSPNLVALKATDSKQFSTNVLIVLS